MRLPLSVYFLVVLERNSSAKTITQWLYTYHLFGNYPRNKAFPFRKKVDKSHCRSWSLSCQSSSLWWRQWPDWEFGLRLACTWSSLNKTKTRVQPILDFVHFFFKTINFSSFLVYSQTFISLFGYFPDLRSLQLFYSTFYSNQIMW